jgi:soluble lytic murein transglycosylase
MGIAIAAVAVGAGAAWLPWERWLGRDPAITEPAELTPESQLNAIFQQPPEQQTAALQELANAGNPSDRFRARFLLAARAVEQGQGGTALAQLGNLERDYPLMAPAIAVLRAKSHTQAGDPAAATAQWQALLTAFPEAPETAEALYALNASDPSYGDRALAPESPVLGHPQTIQLAKDRLAAKQGNQRQNLSVIVRYAPHDPQIGTYLTQLEQGYGDQLTPEEWEAIAYVYWRKWQYGQAGAAYAKATPSPQNAYRAGRGLQLGRKRPEAIAAYRRAIEQFPEAPETGTALVRLAGLLPPQERLALLDRAIANFPTAAGDALLAKSQALDALNSAASASQARQTLLKDYGDSDAAAELRWELAEKAAAAGDLRTAWQYAAAIPADAPRSELAPRAAFWVGKWAAQLGQTEDSRQAYEQLLIHYPGSYYTWRAADLLGYPVGNFQTLRTLNPEINHPTVRQTLPVGSPVLQELYQLRRDREAWGHWQVEFGNRRSPSVEEQFVDGVMRLGIGDNLNGIFMIDNLTWRDLPEERTALAQLQETATYWDTLYPFPYQPIIQSWSQQRNLNPMLVTGLIRQESRFETEIRSVADAVGLMQVLPSTGRWIADKIGMGEFDLTDPDDNIALGTWFLNYTHDEYDGNTMLAVASYNAGPGNVSKWVRERGLGDPDAFVEDIPFPETRGYVEAVLGNYWNYLRLYNPEMAALVDKYAQRR